MNTMLECHAQGSKDMNKRSFWVVILLLFHDSFEIYTIIFQFDITVHL